VGAHGAGVCRDGGGGLVPRPGTRRSRRLPSPHSWAIV
jgi:hypothetical protein